MNYIFYFLVVVSIIIGAINGKLQDVVNAIMSGAELSVKIAFSLIGIMAFWLGIKRIAEKSGIIEWVSKILRPITKILFNELKPNSPAIGDIAMNPIREDGSWDNCPLSDRLLSANVECLKGIPNVILVACGAKKVQAIKAALRTNCIDTLITDETTAREILEIVKEEE